MARLSISKRGLRGRVKCAADERVKEAEIIMSIK